MAKKTNGFSAEGVTPLTEEWDIEKLYQASADITEGAELEVFAQAEQIANRNARVLLKMALLAHKYRRSQKFLKILTFCWGMSAGNMARAVARRKEWFTTTSEANVTQMRILFVLGQVDSYVDSKFYEYWRSHQTLQPWELQRMVTAWKQNANKRKAKPEKIRLKAQALHLNYGGAMPSVEFGTTDAELEDVVEGAAYNVSLEPQPEEAAETEVVAAAMAVLQGA